MLRDILHLHVVAQLVVWVCFATIVSIANVSLLKFYHMNRLHFFLTLEDSIFCEKARFLCGYLTFLWDWKLISYIYIYIYICFKAMRKSVNVMLTTMMLQKSIFSMLQAPFHCEYGSHPKKKEREREENPMSQMHYINDNQGPNPDQLLLCLL